MEIRASYVLVGAVVLAILVGIAAFSVWLVKADGDRQVALYEIAFAGSVSGLQKDGQVRYRGIPVGRVANIRIDPENVENVLVEVEIEQDTPIKQDTIANLEMQGVTGIAYVQLRGGTHASPALEPDADGEMPRIASERSALERVFESTPDLLVRALALVDRIALIFDDRNREAIGSTLQDIAVVAETLAAHSEDLGVTLAGTAEATHEIKNVAVELRQLTAELRQVTAKLDPRIDQVGDDMGAALAEVRDAATATTDAAGRLDQMVGDLREPLGDFSSTGLYEFTHLVGESRELIAALTRITKEFERDPAGFLIGSGRGFEAE